MLTKVRRDVLEFVIIGFIAVIIIFLVSRFILTDIEPEKIQAITLIVLFVVSWLAIERQLMRKKKFNNREDLK